VREGDVKILLVTPMMSSGGAETVVYDVASGLAGKGHSVAVASSGGRLADDLMVRGITVHEFPALAGKRPMQVLGAIPALARLLRSERYDAVNAHAFLTAVEVWCARLISRAPVPLVFTLHLQERKGLYPVMAKTLRFIAARVITVCRSTKVRLADSGLPAEMVEVLYNGVDVANFPLREPNPPGRPLRVGVVARLVERKGHRFLLEAMARLGDDGDCPEFSLDVVGDGPAGDELRQLTARLGLSDRVNFLGDTGEIPSILAQMDIFVLPSTYEAFPVSLLEAMSTGVAVLATDVDGVPELIEDGVTGVLVPPRDVERLAAALKGLLLDDNKRERLAQAGASHVRNGFTLEYMVGGYEDFFLSLATSRAPVAPVASVPEERREKTIERES
jgi:glycosyltransferase involved in cell wall biosynthesis